MKQNGTMLDYLVAQARNKLEGLIEGMNLFPEKTTTEYPSGKTTYQNTWNPLRSPTATPRPTVTPTPKPTAIPTPTQGAVAGYRSPETQVPTNYPAIPYNTDKGTTQYVPESIAQLLMEVFDATKQATPAASVLYHPRERTMLPWEEEAYNNGQPYYAGGENRGFQTGREVDIPNPNGSIDRGLFRINSDTFAEWMKKRGDVLKGVGINNWDDMLDPKKNMIFAKLLSESRYTQNEGDISYRDWWAAPLKLRHPSITDDYLAQRE